ncbi:MAG: hypothetical protein ACR2IE_16015 [Candidatus Sumerlaeaceae bacterium]
MSNFAITEQNDLRIAAPGTDSVPTLPPQPAEEFKPEPVSLDIDMIRRSFRQPVKPYTGDAGGGMAAMLTPVIPVVYFMLLAGLAYCLLMLLFRTEPELKAGLPSIRGFLSWAAPIAASFAMLYYMIKPLFLKKSEMEKGKELSRAQQPLLFAFVDHVAKTTGVPPPARIYVDCGMTMRAQAVTLKTASGTEFRLELTIGLTGLSAFNTRKLAAAICCELARFRDGGGAALRVEKIAAWLKRIVMYRDSFDHTLEEFSEKPNRIIRTVAVFMRWMVRVIRGLLDGMLATVCTLGRTCVKQKQFGADHLAAQLSGPIDFNGLLMQLQALRITAGIAERNLKRIINDSLPANWPGFVAASQANIPQEVRRPFQQQMDDAESKQPTLGATRSERLSHLAGMERVPLLSLDVPAENLLLDYEDVCTEVTIQHYQCIYGDEYRKAWLRPNPEFMSQIGYSIYKPDTRDTMIDYHEGDRWQPWRKRLSTVGGIVMTVGLVVHTGFQLASASEPMETKYRRYIGSGVLVRGGTVREVLDVKFYDKDEVVGYDPDRETDVLAPATGWYYDTGQAKVVLCKKAVFLDGIDQETEDEKIVREQFEINESIMRKNAEADVGSTPDVPVE